MAYRSWKMSTPSVTRPPNVPSSNLSDRSLTTMSVDDSALAKAR
jgi:hypothetical protein